MLIQCSWLIILLMARRNTNSQRVLDDTSSAGSCHDLKLLSWNASGMMSSASYLGSILHKKNIDICGISEHWLYNRNIHFLQSVSSRYRYFAAADRDLDKPSRRKVGKGGVALFWRQELDRFVSVLDIDDDRILGIQIQISPVCYVYVIQVYLPSSNHCMQEFEDYMLKLQDIYSSFSDKGTLIIMGDFNAHQNGYNFVKRYDRRSVMLRNFLACNNLASVNTLPNCTGASATFVSYCGDFKSTIDHIVVPVESLDLLSICSVLDDDALNVSTHRPILCILSFSHAEQTDLHGGTEATSSVKWRNIKDEDISRYRECEEGLFSDINTDMKSWDTRN